MPSKNKKQHRLMEAVKHNPKFARKVGIPQSVGADYVAADKRAKLFARGGGVLGMLLAKAHTIPDSRAPGLPATIRRADDITARMGRRLERIRNGNS